MNFNKFARKINRQVELLVDEGYTEDHEIFNRMAAFLPDFGQLWNNTSDKELLSLMKSYPAFERFCQIVETLYAQEQSKESRVYDGLSKFNEKDSAVGKQLFSEAATIENTLSEYLSTSYSIDTHDLNVLRSQIASWVERKQIFLDGLSKSEMSQHSEIMNNIFAPIEDRLNNGIQTLIDSQE